LSASSIPLTDLPAALAKKLPRYPLVPAVRVGRLAVATSERGKGLGAGLIVDGITRSWTADIMAYAMVVDAKDDAAVAFYRHHGFTAFASLPRTLFLPLAAVAKQRGLADRK
jgi:predicted GNAT family N-acyltransferase